MVYIYVVCAHECRCLQSLEMSAHPGAEVIGDCALFHVGARWVPGTGLGPLRAVSPAPHRGS